MIQYACGCKDFLDGHSEFCQKLLDELEPIRKTISSDKLSAMSPLVRVTLKHLEGSGVRTCTDCGQPEPEVAFGWNQDWCDSCHEKRGLVGQNTAVSWEVKAGLRIAPLTRKDD